jgi:CubicO group peptidase (beta-lactamase class C family)/peroxiredoxin
MKFFLILLLFSSPLWAQNASLPRSTPEKEGVSSENILQFLEAVSHSKHELHSYMILRHGKVISEGWWHPYRPDLKHTMYSVSKSFTATAIGFAVSEKKLTVEDLVISFFSSKDLPDSIPLYLAQLRVKDLLTMSVGQETDPTWSLPAQTDWTKGFFKIPIIHKPGTQFLYNSMATYMLSAILQQVTGEKLLDYLKPRLFNPLDIKDIDWETNPTGVNVGGWGLRIKTEDMAKFGQLFLQKGSWEGKQILPNSWVEAATSVQILQEPNASQAKKDSSDWLQGYGYQMWRSRHRSFRADGAYGQFIMVLPEQDAVIAITAESPDMQDELNLIWEHLLPAFQSKILPENPTMLGLLNEKAKHLALPIAPQNATPAFQSNIADKILCRVDEKTGETMRFQFRKDSCQLVLTQDSIQHTLLFGHGGWISSETDKLGPYLVAGAKSNRMGLAPFKTMGNYIWKSDSSLELTLRYIESPHTETYFCRFSEDTVFIEIQHFFNKNAPKKVLKFLEISELPKKFNRLYFRAPTDTEIDTSLITIPLDPKEHAADTVAYFEGMFPNEMVPPFGFTDINGKEILQRDLLGKMVYIEFYSTTCPSCLEHLRAMQPVIAANKNIVFLFISLDSNHNFWKDFISRKKFGGTHVSDQYRLISMYWNIQAMPNFLVINKKGRIILNSMIQSQLPLEMLLQSENFEN